MKHILATIAMMATVSGVAKAGDDPLLLDVIEWGASAAQIEKALDGKCANSFVNRVIDPPFLPNGPAKQVQIDCDGYDFLGAPRWVEFVIGDDRLQMVWVMVEASDREMTLQALGEAYGEPSHKSDLFTAYIEHRAAWREDPPEVLFYGEELDAAMKGWIESTQ